MKTIVRVPYCRARSASAMTCLISLMPVSTAENSMNSAFVMRDDLCQSGLARPRRAPEDERANIVALQLGAQRLPGRNQMLLANKLIERPRTHAVGKRPGTVSGAVAATRNRLE